MVGAVQAHGSDTYDPATKQVTIPSIIIGNATYSNMVVTVGKIVSGPTGSAPTSTGDFFNPANNQLAIPVVTYGANTYYNVVIAVGRLVSIGGVTGADTYDGKNLAIPSVQVLGGAIYSNVVITVGNIISAGGGMPTNFWDAYDPASKQLTIAAIQLGSKVYTNAIITVGYLVSAGGNLTDVTQYTNALDGRFFTANVGNGFSYTLSGDKSTAGAPLNLRWVAANQNGFTSQLGFDPQTGLLAAAGPSAGFYFRFSWTAGVLSNVTAITPNGQTINVPLKAQAASSPFSRKAISQRKSFVSTHTKPTRTKVFLGLHSASDTSNSDCETADTLAEVVCTGASSALSDIVQSCAAFGGAVNSLPAPFTGTGEIFSWGCLGVAASTEAICHLVEVTNAELCNLVDKVIDSATAPTAELSANVNSVTVGTPFTINWSSTFATECTASEGSPGDGWAGELPYLNGWEQVSESAPGQYTFKIICSVGSQVTPPRSVTVTVLASTSVSGTADPPMIVSTGGPVTFTATITPQSTLPAGTPLPDGGASFFDQNGVPLCLDQPVVAGVSTCSATISAAPDTITVSYSGNSIYAPSTGTISVGLYVITEFSYTVSETVVTATDVVGADSNLTCATSNPIPLVPGAVLSSSDIQIYPEPQNLYVVKNIPSYGDYYGTLPFNLSEDIYGNLNPDPSGAIAVTLNGIAGTPPMLFPVTDISTAAVYCMVSVTWASVLTSNP
jgi:hypothetical protein